MISNDQDNEVGELLINSAIQKHIFFCTNTRNNKNRSCGLAGANNLYLYAKQKARNGEGRTKNHVRINSAGCLGLCEKGPCAVIYPEGTWYQLNNTNDVDKVLRNHLISSTQEKLD